VNTVKISVIVSTFNSPASLEKALWGYRSQTHADFELLVADDGSGPETAALLERMRRRTRLRIEHVWHANDGFRKCRILNRAIEQACGHYLIFSDGDCIPRADFVATHAGLARRGFGLSGGCVRLPRDAGDALSEHDIFSGRCMRPDWLRARGLRQIRDLLKLWASEGVAGRLADALTPTRPSFNGHNASVWRDDVLRVNGFDERMQYGGLDREFGERLRNAGVRFLQVRHRAICLHLDHPRPYVTAESWHRNRAIREETRRGRLTWTPCGILSTSAPALEPAIRLAA
jgi:glycosyltransferase involved in cell wall biosynthesis